MAEALSVKALREEAEDTYPGLPLALDDNTVVTLRNLLRLDDTAQKNANILIESMQGAKQDASGNEASEELAKQKRTIRDLLLLIADNPAALRPELDTWDLAMLLIVMERWTALTQVPEASGSAE